jgi:hypothetical protein
MEKGAEKLEAPRKETVHVHLAGNGNGFARLHARG